MPTRDPATKAIDAAPLTKLTIYHFRHMLQRPVATVMGPLTCRPALILKLEDADGFAGYGEIWCNFPPDGDLHRARLAQNLLPGALARTTQPPLFDTLMHRFRNLALQAGEPGPLAQVAAGADIASMDISARRAGVPLSVYLGGSVRPVPAYASGISPELWPEQLDRMRARGYRDFKLRIGFGPEDSLPQARLMAKELTSQESLRVDANQAWSFSEASARLGMLEEIAPSWLEEPLAADAPLAEWQQLAQKTAIPLAAAENLRSEPDFMAAIHGGALAYFQPDICKWGGLSGGARIARAALAAGVTYCPHYLGGGVGLIASAHLLAAVGGDGLLEVDSSENPLSEDLSAHDGYLQKGLFTVPDAPGLGYDPDIESMRDLLVSKVEIGL